MVTNPNQPPKGNLWKLLIVIACLAFTVIGISKISVDVDILKLLPSELPVVRGLTLFLKNFAQPDQLIVTLESDDPDTTSTAVTELVRILQSREDLAKQVISAPPWESSSADISELAAFLALNQSPQEFAELEHRLAPGNRAQTLRETLEKIDESGLSEEAAQLAYDPYRLIPSLKKTDLTASSRLSEFSSADGCFRVLYLIAPQPFTNYKATSRWISEIKRTTQVIANRPGIRLGFTGEPAFVSDVSSTMEWDMSSSGFGTMLLIALVFWACYRRAIPLLTLQLMLLLVFALTLGAAGLFLHQLTVIGVGCAAIMIGLSVDYGYFIYQRSLQHSGTLRELQSQCFQYIVWTAGTTAVAFFSLNLSSLPGLSQLGNLVGFGVVIGAVVMLTVFAPLTLLLKKNHTRNTASHVERILLSPSFQKCGFIATLISVTGLLIILCFKGFPGTDFSPSCLRPKHSDAYTALDHLSDKLTDQRNALQIVIEGSSLLETHQRLQRANSLLSKAKQEGEIYSFLTPARLWPNAQTQFANLSGARELAQHTNDLKSAALENGFTTDAFALTEKVFAHWLKWANRSQSNESIFWPENATSRWILKRLINHDNGRFLAAGMVFPVAGNEAALLQQIQGPGTYLINWPQLGVALQKTVPRELLAIMLALGTLVLGLLAVALRSLKSLLCFVISTSLTLVCLASAMSLLGMTWNLFNLAAILLLLGTGTDYSILILLSLRRNGGSVTHTQKELFLIISLCAISAATGFGTIGWANHQGLAALGKTCALGLILDAMISLFLLPPLWLRLNRSTHFAAAD